MSTTVTWNVDGARVGVGVGRRAGHRGGPLRRSRPGRRRARRAAVAVHDVVDRGREKVTVAPAGLVASTPGCPRACRTTGGVRSETTTWNDAAVGFPLVVHGRRTHTVVSPTANEEPEAACTSPSGSDPRRPSTVDRVRHRASSGPVPPSGSWAAGYRRPRRVGRERAGGPRGRAAADDRQRDLGCSDERDRRRRRRVRRAVVAEERADHDADLVPGLERVVVRQQREAERVALADRRSASSVGRESRCAASSTPLVTRQRVLVVSRSSSTSL